MNHQMFYIQLFGYVKILSNNFYLQLFFWQQPTGLCLVNILAGRSGEQKSEKIKWPQEKEMLEELRLQWSSLK